jgi:hypothetical protein
MEKWLMKLYDLYVRFLVWLGAAPPSGYEHLLEQDGGQRVPAQTATQAIEPSDEDESEALLELPSRPAPLPIEEEVEDEPEMEAVIAPLPEQPVRPLPPPEPVAVRPPEPPAQPNDGETVKRLYQTLLTRTMGDKQKVERLVKLERQRAPQASTVELLQRALERWEREQAG